MESTATTSVAAHLRYWGAFLCNLLLAYVVYMLCRVAYVWENWSLFAAGWPSLSLGDLLAGSLRFDTAAICYTLIPYAALMLFPLPLSFRLKRGYQLAARWLFVVANALAVVINLCDAVYSQYTGRRTTSTFFSEFSNDGNLGSIVGVELLHHWYLVLIGIVLIGLVWLLYRAPRPAHRPYDNGLRNPYIAFAVDFIILALATTLFIIGMRGGASKAIRPIAISNANQYVNNPQEAAIVLNTPFSLIRTAGKTTFSEMPYFDGPTLDSLYNPVHAGADSQEMNRRNVVVLIVESFASEYIGALNDYEGYTPFIDSLIGESLTFSQSFSNGRKSIDGMPSILSSIPMFVEPFFVTHYSLNTVSGLAGELGREGYSSAFFHGAENGSMGFQAFARTTGFQRYYGRTEYDADSRFGGEVDFDGTWAIWDEPFLQFYAHTMSDLQEPFVTALFTASSHHPFVVPDRYKDSLHAEGHPMYTCIRYTDMALRHFFETARRQPWFERTLFVITADHTNFSEREEYRSALGRYRVPIIFYDPSGQLPRGRREGIAQQIDIMPTLLDFLGYSSPYVAFGKSLLTTPADSSWAVNYNNGIYQLVQGDHLLQYDGHNVVGLYRYTTDPLLQENLAGTLPAVEQTLLPHLQAIMQSYMHRMIANELVVNEQTD